jgi:hypothetical protein
LLRRSVLLLMLSLAGWLMGCDGGGYAVKGGRWHYEEQPLDAVHGASFKPLGRHFARDKDSGYYRGGIVTGSHGPSFEALGEHEARDRRAVFYADTYRKAQEYWSVRHHRVFQIAGADPASFRVLEHGYAADRARAYYEGEAFKVHDAASFEPLGSGFARDRARGYYERVAIPDSHGASFAMVDPGHGGYARDRQQVVHGHIEINSPGRGPHPVVRVLRGAQLAQFRVLGAHYASDSQRVWHRGEELADADAASFELLPQAGDDADARDARGSYLRGRRSAPGRPPPRR